MWSPVLWNEPLADEAQLQNPANALDGSLGVQRGNER